MAEEGEDEAVRTAVAAGGKHGAIRTTVAE